MAVTGQGVNILKCTASGDTATGTFSVSYVRWVGAGTASDVCTLTDSNGNEFWHSEADGANFIDIHPLFRTMHGIDVSAMTSGTLYVYCK